MNECEQHAIVFRAVSVVCASHLSCSCSRNQNLFIDGNKHLSVVQTLLCLLLSISDA